MCQKVLITLLLNANQVIALSPLKCSLQSGVASAAEEGLQASQKAHQCPFLRALGIEPNFWVGPKPPSSLFPLFILFQMLFSLLHSDTQELFSLTQKHLKEFIFAPLECPPPLILSGLVGYVWPMVYLLILEREVTMAWTWPPPQQSTEQPLPGFPGWGLISAPPLWALCLALMCCVQQ